MKPIQTNHRGCKFRSRTEARWAVFFDTIGYRWQYEEQGYVLSNGRCYLPDFKLILPDEEIVYAEVKNYEFDDLGDEEIEDFRVFTKELQKPLIILSGIPEYRSYNMINPEHEDNAFAAALFQDYEPYIRVADSYWFQYLKLDEETGKLLLDPDLVDDRQAGMSFGKKYSEAIKAARSARFEHGEKPKGFGNPVDPKKKK